MATSATPSRNRLPANSVNGRMTEQEFVQWCTDDTWAEWVDGEVVVMNAVSLSHNDMYHFVLHLMLGFVNKLQLGRVLSEPFQIRLPRQRTRRAPDIAFVSTTHLDQLEENQFNGGPDLIVEIVSPESQERDRTQKFGEYEAAGVKEYWLVDPGQRRFDAYSLGSDGNYQLLPVVDGSVRSVVLPGLFLGPTWVYQLKLPDVDVLLRQMIRSHRQHKASRRRR